MTVASTADEFGHLPATIGAGRRILHITTRHRRGGAERNIAHMVAWELAHGYEVDVVVGRDSDPASFPGGTQLRRVDALVRQVDPVLDWQAWRQLRRLMSSEPYDLVHTHLSKAGILGRAAGHGHVRRIIHTVHMASFGHGYGRVQSRLFRAAERWAAGFTHELIFVGNDLRSRYLRNGVGAPETSTVIHSPIDIDRFIATRSWTDAARRGVRSKKGLGEGPLVVSVGTLERRKRHHLLLTALRSRLVAGDLTLVIAGDGRERARLEHQAREFGVSERVSFLGHEPDIAPVVAAADVLALTSTVEGVPQVVIQALAAGRHVVATDVPGLREIPNAPITIVPPDGAGLGEAIESAFSSKVPKLDRQAFDPWTCAQIDRAIAGLHSRLDS